MKFKVLVFVIMILSGFAHAGDRNEKIKILMESLGLLDMWSQQIAIGKDQSQKMAQQMIDQMMSELNPSEEFQEKFKIAFDDFLAKVQTPWTAEEIVNVWASYYGPAFTDDELDQLIAFYTSPLGQKDVRTTKNAMVEFSDHFQKEGQPLMEKAISEYVQDLKLIAKECNCAM